LREQTQEVNSLPGYTVSFRRLLVRSAVCVYKAT